MNKEVTQRWIRILRHLLSGNVGCSKKVTLSSYIKEFITDATAVHDYAPKVIKSDKEYYQQVKELISALKAILGLDELDCKVLSDKCDGLINKLEYIERVKFIYKKYKDLDLDTVDLIEPEPCIAYESDNEATFEIVETHLADLNNSILTQGDEPDSVVKPDQIVKPNTDAKFQSICEEARSLISDSDMMIKTYMGLVSRKIKQEDIKEYLSEENDRFLIHKICSDEDLYKILA
ncbi:hypothetical protein QK685_sRNA6cgp1 [Perilla mosaic virus]|uniref:Uncharacterized protein n=1 Tax=Perilla mosaic virus TaxID=2483037 RepID=A0A6F8PH61_9VIRU|nr:hypothetical protein QK685_sRNA6cgp1 [Perilla mosaic virus]BBM96185.1 hypothetical protein [Perilla mosaic virus]